MKDASSVGVESGIERALSSVAEFSMDGDEGDSSAGKHKGKQTRPQRSHNIMMPSYYLFINFRLSTLSRTELQQVWLACSGLPLWIHCPCGRRSRRYVRNYFELY
jgi:hypothetical protein